MSQQLTPLAISVVCWVTVPRSGSAVRHALVAVQAVVNGRTERVIGASPATRLARTSRAPSRYVPSRGVADLRSLSLIILVMAARCKEAR
jgi:hypothetical protein